jgi:hypothetical protein
MNIKVQDQNNFITLDKLINKTELRNSQIRYFWEGLKYSNLPYKERKRIVMENWFISSELVDRIITRNC